MLSSQGVQTFQRSFRGSDEADSAAPTVQSLMSALLNLRENDRNEGQPVSLHPPTMNLGHHILFLSQSCASSVASFSFNIIVFSHVSLLTQGWKGNCLGQGHHHVGESSAIPQVSWGSQSSHRWAGARCLPVTHVHIQTHLFTYQLPSPHQ